MTTVPIIATSPLLLNGRLERLVELQRRDQAAIPIGVARHQRSLPFSRSALGTTTLFALNLGNQGEDCDHAGLKGDLWIAFFPRSSNPTRTSFACPAGDG
jgi:hypothetical protein